MQLIGKRHRNSLVLTAASIARICKEKKKRGDTQENEAEGSSSRAKKTNKTKRKIQIKKNNYIMCMGIGYNITNKAARKPSDRTYHKGLKRSKNGKISHDGRKGSHRGQVLLLRNGHNIGLTRDRMTRPDY